MGPLLPSLLSEERMPVLDVTLPTLLESSMLPRGRLRLMLMLSTVPMVLATLVWDTLVWATAMPVLATLPLPLPPLLPSLLSPQLLPATPTFPHLPLSPPWELPLLPSLLSEELMLVLDVMLPTLLESSTLGAAPAAIPAVGGAYAGAGRYVANSAGVVHAALEEFNKKLYFVGLLIN